MADINHMWSGDLIASPTGDLSTIDGINLGTQLILRRLMTAPGEYIWHPDYGAGIPQRIGQVKDLRVIKAIIRSQIFKESFVARTPPPTIKVTDFPGGVSVYIKYFDKTAQKAVTITFPIQARPYSQSSQSALSVEVPV